MRIRALSLVLSLLLAGCAAAGSAGVAPATGSWTLAAVNGEPLPAPSPGEAGVTVEAGALELGSDGEYTLDLSARVGRWGAAELRRAYGRFRLVGGELVLQPREALAEPLRFAWRVEGGMLHLRDERGAEFAFSRR
jgi:hypothetical protein